MKKRSLKASFVITFAGSSAALVAPGCVSEIGTTNPPGFTCPEAEPSAGAPCPELGLTCAYPNACGGPELTCGADGVWTVEYTVSCNPPEVLACPDAMPIHGEPSCFGVGTCEYTDECGLPVTASCPAGVWEVVSQGVCNPPATCNLFGSVEECSGSGSCRWLVPGCGDPMGIPALPQAGCHPLDACVDDTSCATGTACKQVMVTPSCVAEGCDSCGEAVSLCL